MADPSPIPFGERHPILKQAVIDAGQLTWQQIGVPALTTLSAFAIQVWNDYMAQRLNLGENLKTVLYSVSLGVVLYVLVALVRAPFVVIGRHQRHLADLSQRLATLPGTSFQIQPQSPTNSFSDFRVISEEPSRLEFEVWYFYDGALGNDGIEMRASLENNGMAVGGVAVYEDVSVVNHKALAKIVLPCKPKEGETSAKSTHIVLAMENSGGEVFYRQFIPYEKVWLHK